MTDIFGGENPHVLFEHMPEMVLIVKADRGGKRGDRCKFSGIDQLLCTADAVNIEIAFEGLVEAFFKQSAKMIRIGKSAFL